MRHPSGSPILRGLLRAWLLVSLTTAASLAEAQAPVGYRLQPGDQIEVSVWGEEELLRTVLLGPDGKFSFPLTGEIAAAGRSASDVQAELRQKLLPYVPEAVVTVSLTGIEGNRVYVIGQVQRPGSYIMNPQISVLQALSLAGGMTPFAAVDNIIIIRGEGSDQEVLRFGYSNVSRGRDLAQNIQLESGDVVIVP